LLINLVGGRIWQWKPNIALQKWSADQLIDSSGVGEI
jgi:hypothetical protein